MQNKKRLLIILISAVLVLAVGLTVLLMTVLKPSDDSSSSASDSTGDVDYAEGKFYYEAEDENGQKVLIELELKKDLSYSLTVNGTAKSGSYTKNGSRIELLDGGKAAYTLTDNGDTVEMTYDGYKVTLIEDVTYTVSFAGVEGYNSLSIRNGKIIGEVADPSKEGYSFVGWYKEAAFETRVYPAIYVVKSDVTLYARFSNTTANGYKVKRYSRSGELLGEETVEVGKSLELADMGEGFLGWWTSDAMDSGKLTAKVEDGTVLAEDTVLYAVYETDYEEGAPVGVSVNENGVTWTAVEGALYDVAINFGNTKVASKPAFEGNSFDFAFASKDAGEYAVTVSCNGKATTVYYTNKLLARPSGLSVDGMLFSFATVKDATAYYLTLNGKNISLGANTYFDFSDYEMPKDGLKFVVKAHAAGYADSTSFELELIRKLDEVENIAYANGKLTWDAVEGAAQYEVIVNGKTAFVEDNEFDVSDLYGDLNVSVRAIAKGYYSDATTAQIDKEDLATPKGLNYYVKDGKEYVEWTKDDNAAAYELKITGKKGGSTTTVTPTLAADATSYELDASAFDADSDLTFELIAKSASGANNSLAATLTVTCGKVENVAYSDGKVTWAPVRNTAEYTVVLPDGTEAKTAKAEYASVTFDKAGDNAITVKAGAASAEIKVTAYAITFMTNSITVPTLYHAYGDTVVLPDADLTRTGYDFAGWADAAGVRLGESFVMEEKATVTLYAAWEPKEYNVTLDAGDYGKDFEDGKTTVTVKYGKSDAVFFIPELNGADNSKLFLGWYTQPAGNGTRLTDENGIMLKAYGSPYDSTVYAHWVTAFAFDAAETNEDGSAKSYSVKAGPDIDKFAKATVTVPSTYNGKPIKVIESNAFYDCDFAVLNIPNSVYTIELISTDTGSAFASCYYLEEINVYDVGDLVLEQDKRYFSEDGVLYFEHETAVTNFNNTEIAYVPRSKEGKVVVSDKTEVIPMGVLGSMDGATTSGSHKFTEVEIPYTVTKIEDKAFISNTRVVKVTFLAAPAGKQEQELALGQSVFQGCSYLTTIDFPARLTTFDASVFDGCLRLANVNIAAANKNYSSIDGVVLNKDGDKLLYYPQGREATEEHPEYAKYTTPDSVTTICSNAFSGSKVVEIVIGKNVTMIEPYAFSGTSDGKSYSGLAGNYKGTRASNIASITFEDGGEMPLTIAEGAFYGSSSSLTEITLPGRLKVLGPYAFGDKSSLKTVRLEADPDALQGGDFDYSDKAFVAYSKTGAVTTPAIVTLYIGKTVPATINIAGVFGSRNLKTVEIEEGNPYLESKDQVIYDKQFTTIVYYLDSREGEYVIPDTVTEIKAGTFKQKDGLTKITIHNGVTYIGDQAFYNCKKLAEVIMEEGGDATLNLGDGVFENCWELTDVQLSTRIRTIGSKLFKGVRTLAEIVIPEGVTELGDEAFGSSGEGIYNDALRKVTLPSTLEKFGTYETVDGHDTLVSLNAFLECRVLAEIVVPDSNPYFKTYDGVLYAVVWDSTYNENVEQLVFCSTAKEGKVIVRENVTKVWTNAFRNNTKTTEIEFLPANEETMPAGMKGKFSLEIGENAFLGCKLLTKISLPEGLTEILSNTFKDCATLEEVVIPSTVTRIDGGTYKSTPYSYGAFNNCQSLTTITFAETPEGKTPVPLEIGDGYIYSYGGSSGPVVYSYYGPFQKCPKLTSIDFPERMTYLGEVVFTQSNIESVILPSTLKSVGYGAFYQAEKLKSVEFRTDSEGKTALTEIASCMFRSSGIEEIVIPEGITSIAYGAFMYCYELKSVSIPSTVTVIGASGVSGCTGGSYKPSQSTGYAFSGDTNLSSITFEGDSQLEIIEERSFQNIAVPELVLPASVTEIGQYAFNSASMNKLSFETKAESEEEGARSISALKKIGDYAFQSSMLQELILPETAETLQLGKNLFASCNTLKYVYMPSTVVGISNVFDNCKASFRIEISDENPSLRSHESAPFIINEIKGANEDGEEIYIGYSIAYVFGQITGSNGGYTEFEIPEHTVTIKKATEDTEAETQDIPCLEIQANAFAEQLYITKVTIPYTVVTIGAGAFNGCTALNEVEFGYNKGLNNLTSLGTLANSKGVFQNCYSLAKIVLPNNSINADADGNSQIYRNTFQKCLALEKVGVTPTDYNKIEEIDYGVYLPANTSVLGEQAEYASGKSYGIFQDCYNLKEVTLPANVTYIGNAMFANCFALETITYAGSKEEGNALSDKVETIGTGAFAYTKSLKTIKLPKNEKFERLPIFIFEDSGIETITIPSNIKYVGNGTTSAGAGRAFQRCTNLTEIKFETDGEGNVINNVILFGQNTFTESAITEMDLSSATMLGTNLFKDCKNLKKVVLNDKLDALPNYMFSGCTSLTGIETDAEGNPVLNEDGSYKYTINLPESLIHMGQYTFKGSGLVAIKIPEKVTALTSSLSYAKAAAKYGNYNVISEVFSTCTNLKSVIIEGTIEHVGKNAFYLCENLEEILTPDPDNEGQYTADGFFSNLKYAGDYAFKGTGIKKVNLDSAENLGAELFMDSAVEEVYISKSITANGGKVAGWRARMFKNCKNLKGVKCDENGNPIKDAEGNYTYTLVLPEDGFYFGSYTFEASGVKAVKFGKKVTTIGSDGTNATKYTGSTYLFQNCTDLEEVIFEGEINQISGSVFNGCTALKTVTGMENVTYIGASAFKNTAIASLKFNKAVTFGTNAFENCDSLTSVEFAETQKELSASLFYSCNNLSEINLPDSITTLGLNCLNGIAFNEETLKLPKSLVTISNGALWGFEGTFEMDDDAKNFKVVDGVLFSKDGSILYLVPQGKEGALDLSDVTEIKSYAFAFADKITGITMPTGKVTLNTYSFAEAYIPEGVDLTALLAELGTVPAYTFQNAHGIGDLVIPEGFILYKTSSSFIEHVFEGSDVKTVVIPGSMGSIPNDTFKGCEQLEKVTISEGVEEIRYRTFMNCTSLKEIVIPASMNFIGGNSFEGCTSLTKVMFSEGVTHIHTVSKYSVDSKVFGKEVSYTGSTSANVFAGCPIEEVVFPSTLVSIGAGAFLNCNITNLVFPASLTEIGASAFEGNNIQSITFEKDAEGKSALTSIGAKAFLGHSLTGKLEIPEGVTTIGEAAFAGKERVEILNEAGEGSGEYDYTGCATLTEVVLPSTLTEVTKSAFAYLYNLAKVNVENIGRFNALSFAYAGILNDEGIELTFGTMTNVNSTIHKVNETTHEVESLGDGPFGYANIKKMTFLDAENIKGKLLHSISKMPEIVFPEGLTALPDYFYYGSFFEEITIPANIESLGANTFEYCINLKKVVFADGSQLKTIGSYSFSYCINLESVNLPDSLESMGIWAFRGAWSLKALVIPANCYLDSYTTALWGEDQTLYLRTSKALKYANCDYDFNFDKSGTIGKANIVYDYKG